MARSNELAIIRTRRGLGVLMALSLVGGVGVVAACKDATYIEVKVSGDSSLCSGLEKTRYTLYSRKPGPIVDGDDGAGPEGVLASCDPKLERTFFFGDFTVVPREGKVDEPVLVEMRVNTRGPSSGKDCVVDDKGTVAPTCIVVRRKLRFESGRRIELATYLDDRCLGKTCAEDQTCFRGACVSADVVCDASGCLTEAERAAGSAGLDPSRPANLPPGAIGVDDAGRTVYIDGAVVDEAGRVHLEDGAIVEPDGAFTTEDGAPPPDPDTGLPDTSTGVDSSFPPPDAGADADSGLGGYVNPSCSICPQDCCAEQGTMGPFACRPVCAPEESSCRIVLSPDGGQKVMCSLGIN
ncbi:MAG: hypothetical protein U0183_35040 [Polyangiaceae bacterium]